MDRGKILYATFGAEGAIGYGLKERYRVGISHSYTQDIQPHLVTALGAGDSFIALVMHAKHVLRMNHVDEILQYATQGVLRRLGYPENLPSSAFIVEKIK